VKHLIKVMLVLASVFATTFIVGRLLGILTIENVRIWLEAVQNTNPAWVAALVVALLFIDLVVAVPTLTITILAGFFLGFPMGFAASLTGMSLAAFTGYAMSRIWGGRVLNFLVKDNAEQRAMKETFQISGPAMILLSRAAPIAPEVTACMAGVTRMPFSRYLLLFALSTVPYVAIASYAGSVSAVESPQPAIFAAIILYGVLWCGWFWFRRTHKN
jgi:uncharacterized membrane protein YdjX (TVP38/TMEM64 family)